MKKDKKMGSGYVTKDRMLLVAFIALVLGFLGGVVYSSFKLGSTSTQQQATQEQVRFSEQETRIPALLSLTVQNPKDVEAWVQLGNAYFDTDQYEKSINAYKRSLELDSNNPNVWTDLGVMYRRNSQPLEAIKAFDKAAEVDPKHETCRFNKGIVLMYDLGDRKGAIASWEEILKINPLALAPNGQPLLEMVDSIKKGVKK